MTLPIAVIGSGCKGGCETKSFLATFKLCEDLRNRIKGAVSDVITIIELDQVDTPGTSYIPPEKVGDTINGRVTNQPLVGGTWQL